MKKVLILSLLIVITTIFSSCKSEIKKENKQEVSTKSKAAFSLKSAQNEINFIAYKTSEKVPVGGQFKKIDILSGGEGNSIKEAINNTEFSIPVSSIFTKDTSRDFKIKKFFFGIMDNTKLLSGKLIIENDSIGYSSIKMNGVSAKLPFAYTIKNNVFSLKAEMDINKWNASKALTSLNTACLDLHKGSDGVSKTWKTVSINIMTTF